MGLDVLARLIPPRQPTMDITLDIERATKSQIERAMRGQVLANA
jgi:hypothetical protein